MEIEVLKNKLSRYIRGEAYPAEIGQVEAWLSSDHTGDLQVSDEEKEMIGHHILNDVKCYTAYPLFFPEKSDVFEKIKPKLGRFLLGLVMGLVIYFIAYY